MKKVLILVALFVFAGGLLFAGPIEWGGSFTFKLGANPRNISFDHTAPGEFADISADFEVQIDETNLLHTSVGGTDGISVGDTYLQSDWIIFTTKLGTTAYDSFGYAVSDKEYEVKANSIDGAGVSIEIPIGGFTIGAGKFFDPCIGGVGASWENDILGIGVNYVGDFTVKDETWAHTVSGGVKVALGDFSSGAGIRYDDTVWAGGVGAKYDFGVPHIAAGVGIEQTDDGTETKFGADTGFEFDTWGGLFSASYVEMIDVINMSIWYKPGVVKFKTGYDWNAEAVDEIYIEVSADF